MKEYVIFLYDKNGVEKYLVVNERELWEKIDLFITDEVLFSVYRIGDCLLDKS